MEPKWHFHHDGIVENALKHRMEKPMTENTVRKITRQILSIMLDYHKENKLMRFITPISFLLDKDDNILAYDTTFVDTMIDGYSTRTDCYDKIHKYYSAPEVNQSSHKHGVLSDYFALGMLVHSMLTGTKPNLDKFFDLRVKRVTCSKFHFKDDASGIPLELKRRIIIKNQNKKFMYDNIDKLSDNARDFVEKMTICWEEMRLGCMGFSEILSHPWLFEISE